MRVGTWPFILRGVRLRTREPLGIWALLSAVFGFFATTVLPFIKRSWLYHPGQREIWPRAQASSAAMTDHCITRCRSKKRSWDRRWKMLIFSVMREEFWRRDICGGARIIELYRRKNFQSDGFSGRKLPPSWKRSKPVCAAFTPSYEGKSSGGKKAQNSENNGKAQRTQKRLVCFHHLT